MDFSNYLRHEKILELDLAILSARLDTPDTRDELLIGIHRGYVSRLPLRRTSTRHQILSDLNEMNGRDRLEYPVGNEWRYEVPLRIWLTNAVHALRGAGGPELRLFQQALDDVTAESEVVIQKAIRERTGGGPAPREELHLEKIVYKSDLLSYGWLRGALAVGESVARLLVPRYENGRPALPNPGSNKPPEWKGTGWLIGKQYLITNHHVIDARSKGEDPPTDEDLRMQAENTVVQFFDYDDEGEAEKAEVESLAAWAAWSAIPSLDFAILKLKQPVARRRPLILAPQALQQAGREKLPVNIIQHPGGTAKSLGIRNNQVYSLEEWELRYYTDTDQGSSGAPVCNDDWQVIALHRAARDFRRNVYFQGKKTAWVNIGVRINRIIDHLKKDYSELWEAMEVEVR